ncbi:hypothetical protein [Paeniglutamicibacter sp.]|uniref:hypothetical protein n=1 Tax=Paeniglutamicibacter sp. TaxID=1934391 RepID=UPI0039899292
MTEELKVEDAGSDSRSDARTIMTSAWRLSVPDTVSEDSPLLVIPTVHPRGDRRIVRCAQVALDAGFRVHFLWLGRGESSLDPLAGETLFPEPQNATERIRMVPRIARRAAQLGGHMWHIHDFYFLGEAKRWRRKSGRAVLYDVHEYYGRYYAGKVPAPTIVQRLIAGAIERYQVRSAKKLGAANVVTEEMAVSFRAWGVPVSVSPNYPMLSQFGDLPSVTFSERRWRVLHIGTLSREYGTELLVQLAARSLQRELPFDFTVLARFPSPGHAQAFEELLARVGAPVNLKLVPTRPTHEMPGLLASAGFGLSLLALDGQNESAVPSKNYEHVMAGMVDVVTDRAAQRQFAESFAVHVSGHADDADAMLDQMIRLAEDASGTETELTEKAGSARNHFTWERAVEPGLRAMLLQLSSKGPE